MADLVAGQELQSFDLDKIITESVRIPIRSSPRKFFLITLSVILPLSIAQLFIDDQHHVFSIWEQFKNPTDESRKQLINAFISEFFSIIILLAFSLFSTAAIVITVASVYASRTVNDVIPTLRAIPRVSRRLFVTLLYFFLLMILYHFAFFVLLLPMTAAVNFIIIHTNKKLISVLITVMVLIFNLVHAYVTAFWHLASVISVLEPNVFGLAAMKKSKQLMRGKTGIGYQLVLMYFCLAWGTETVFRMVVLEVDYDHGYYNWMIRVLVGILCLIILVFVNLLGLIVQSVFYYVCKSFHHEVIDKKVLYEHLGGYVGEQSVPLQSTGGNEMQKFDQEYDVANRGGRNDDLADDVDGEGEESGVQNWQKKETVLTKALSLVLGIRQYKWWLRVTIYTLFIIAGQSAATLLGRFYYDKGGNSKWMATLVQSAGFPVLLIPLFIFYAYSPPTHSTTVTNTTTSSPSAFTLTLLYLSIGLLLAGDNMLYSYGMLYLPVSTFSLLCATQLAFSAVFSYFLNSQKFTPYILNSVVLLTISASLLSVVTNSADSTQVSKGKYIIGILCTLAASAGYSLWLSLTQLVFQRVIKRETISTVLELQIFSSLVATCACLVGLFAGGDWMALRGEMEMYGEGSVSYVMTLVWTAVTWQISSVGSVGLIIEASSLFSNVIGTLALPVIPILAVIFFHDKLNGVKVVAMVLAIWGFVSYIYQHYIDDRKSRKTRTDDDDEDD